MYGLSISTIVSHQTHAMTLKRRGTATSSITRKQENRGWSFPGSLMHPQPISHDCGTDTKNMIQQVTYSHPIYSCGYCFYPQTLSHDYGTDIRNLVQHVTYSHQIDPVWLRPLSTNDITRLWNRYQEHGSTRDLLTSGRRRVTTAFHDRFSCYASFGNGRQLQSPQHLQNNGCGVVDQAVGNLLREAGIRV